MSILAARPVRRLHPPVYPTRLEVLANPEVLRRHSGLPDLFRGEGVPLAAALMAVGLGGCTDADPSPEARRKAALERVAAAAIVAPIFEHGEGRGLTGCAVVSPAVFLSEEEALQVVREELSLADLDMTDSNVPMDDVRIRRFEWGPATDWIGGKQSFRRLPTPSRVPLELDLKDSQHAVAIEFVSMHDDAALRASSPGPLSVSEVEMIDTARQIARRVRADGRGAFVGVFYDPVFDRKALGLNPRNDDVARELRDLSRTVLVYSGSYASEQDKQRSARIREMMSTEPKRLLREQVRDFVEWLKGQGAI